MTLTAADDRVSAEVVAQPSANDGRADDRSRRKEHGTRAASAPAPGSVAAERSSAAAEIEAGREQARTLGSALATAR